MPPLASVRNVLIGALLLAACAQPVLCADYKGTMDWYCCGTGFHLTVSHAHRRRTPTGEIILQLHQGCPGRIPIEMMVSQGRLSVDAEFCGPSSKQCEKSSAAEIYLASVSRNGKHASGDFTVDFPTSGHKEGKFKVKYHHNGPKPICE
jgi:hypothetical protein